MDVLPDPEMEAVNSSEASLKFFQAAVLHPGLK
jgi:hypothetical protein